MATMKRGAFKGHCAMCAMGRKWRRGKRVWPNDVLRTAGRRRRVSRRTLGEVE